MEAPSLHPAVAASVTVMAQSLLDTVARQQLCVTDKHSACDSGEQALSYTKNPFEMGSMRCIGGPSTVLYSQVSVCFKERPTKKIHCGEKPRKSERWL